MIRTRQPQGAVPSLLTGLGSKLRLLYTPTQGEFNLINGTAISIASGTYTYPPKPKGIASLGGGAEPKKMLTMPAFTSGGYTLSVLISGDDGSIDGNYLDDDDGASRAFQLRTNGGTVQFIPFTGGSTGTISPSTPPTTAQKTSGFLLTASVSASGATAIYVDGVKTTGSLGGAPNTPTTSWGLNNRKTSGLAYSRNLFLAAAWDRVLANAEVVSLAANPWQLFAPSRRVVVFGAAAGGGAVTGTASITQSPQTLNGAGTVAVAGTLNKTPAAQTATTAAAVAIAGTLNKTPAAQTVTTAGTVAVSGTFNKAPAAQTLTASGTVASGVTGTANITPAAQTVTAAGTVAIAASATITPSAQTATASGAVQVAATATVTPAAQTVTATGTVVSGVVGNASITPAAQTATASGTVAIAATATVTPAAQTVSATAAVSGGAVTGTANIYVSAQTLVAAANIIVLGTANITPAAQTLLGLEAGTLPAEIPESSRTLSQMAGRLGSEWVDTDPARLGLATARRSRPRLG
jgi:hypothetical protein